MYETSPYAVAVFIAFVSLVLWMSYYFARKTKSSKSYFAAGGTVHWAVNGIAFAGDYLSAASFLGICGMIATYGYDGFLYSIGYLAGWIVALFVIAEPMKRLGKYTFTDALDAKFNSKGIQLAAAISTLVVCMFYLIPQMVGAGTLVTPLLGLPHWLGVVMVGTIVTIIVASAGMTSTTYVQFLKGGLLIIFSFSLVIVTLYKGINTKLELPNGEPYPEFRSIPVEIGSAGELISSDATLEIVDKFSVSGSPTLVKVLELGRESWWSLDLDEEGVAQLKQAYWAKVLAKPVKDSKNKESFRLLNGVPQTDAAPLQAGHVSELVFRGVERDHIGNMGPIEFLEGVRDSVIVRFPSRSFMDGPDKVTVYYQQPTAGKDILRPGLKVKLDQAKGASTSDRLNFISLMMALFLGTAALPHILIRYYTVPTPAAARKSTIVAIAAIGLFYILTLYMGLGAMINGVVDLTDDNMSAPLLAKSFGVTLFALISAIAFATVLGTVAGLIVAASGAVAHDLMDRFFGMQLNDHNKVLAGKGAAILVGICAMALGIVFKGMNVSYLVGLAFAVAASANLPSIVLLLFWRDTTKEGIIGSILTGIVSSVAIILTSPDMYLRYGLSAAEAPHSMNNPAIISVPLSLAVLVLVSLLTRKRKQVAAT